MNEKPVISHTSHLTAPEREALATLVRIHGEESVRQQLQLGKLPLARMLAELPVLRATIALARAGLTATSTGAKP
jgi:hypothetical protein